VSQITQGARTFKCDVCHKNVEVRTIRCDHPDAPEMICTGEGFMCVSEGEDPGHVTMSFVCSEACTIGFLEAGAQEMAKIEAAAAGQKN
jgi:hypothetical protein